MKFSRSANLKELRDLLGNHSAMCAKIHYGDKSFTVAASISNNKIIVGDPDGEVVQFFPSLDAALHEYIPDANTGRTFDDLLADSSTVVSWSSERPGQGERLCLFCETKYWMDPEGLTHPFPQRWCRDCNRTFHNYASIFTDDLRNRILTTRASAGVSRKCRYCGNSFNLIKNFYDSAAYDRPTLSRDGYRSELDPIDFLYPNLFTPICPDCFRNTLAFNYHLEPQQQLDAIKSLGNAVRALGEKIGKLPEERFPLYLYHFSTKEDVEWFWDTLKLLPGPEVIKNRFGSIFELLLDSGLIPKGSKRMRLGTLVRAEDGHMCYSMVERNIDNWLSRHGIKHEKEVNYPNSPMRCDWEVLLQGQRVFIEYFGLMSQEAYARKTEQKIEIAKQNNIELIPIYPETDWATTFERRFRSIIQTKTN